MINRWRISYLFRFNAAYEPRGCVRNWGVGAPGYCYGWRPAPRASRRAASKVAEDGDGRDCRDAGAHPPILSRWNLLPITKLQELLKIADRLRFATV